MKRTDHHVARNIRPIECILEQHHPETGSHIGQGADSARLMLEEYEFLQEHISHKHIRTQLV